MNINSKLLNMHRFVLFLEIIFPRLDFPVLDCRLLEPMFCGHTLFFSILFSGRQEIAFYLSFKQCSGVHAIYRWCWPLNTCRQRIFIKHGTFKKMRSDTSQKFFCSFLLSSLCPKRVQFLRSLFGMAGIGSMQGI